MLIYELIDLESTIQSVTIGFMPILSGFKICSTTNIYLFDVGVLAGYLVNSSVYGSWIRLHCLIYYNKIIIFVKRMKINIML